MHYSDVFDPTRIGDLQLECMQRACRQYPYHDRTAAYDEMMLDPEAIRFLRDLRSGKQVTAEAVGKILVHFLIRWHSRLSNDITVAESLLGPLYKIAPAVAKIPILYDITYMHVEEIKPVFECLDEIDGIGGTTASKILSVLKPETFVMWDIPIAEYYGFDRNSVGYCHFMLLMHGYALRLRELTRAKSTTPEEYLCASDRKWKPTIAKLLDEWNWVSITQAAD